MNKDDSQDIVNTILKAKRNGEKAGIRRYFDRAYERTRHISGKNDGDLGTNKELSNPRRNDRLDSELSRYGAYYDSPELFVKSKRTYKGSKVNYSLITPEMDAYTSAPAAETQTISTSNGDMIADVNEATGQGRFSLRTYREGGREILADFLGTRVSDGALTEAEAQDMMQQMDDIYAFCETMKDHYAPFGQWSEAKVRISAR